MTDQEKALKKAKSFCRPSRLVGQTRRTSRGSRFCLELPIERDGLCQRPGSMRCVREEKCCRPRRWSTCAHTVIAPMRACRLSRMVQVHDGRASSIMVAFRAPASCMDRLSPTTSRPERLHTTRVWCVMQTNASTSLFPLLWQRGSISRARQSSRLALTNRPRALSSSHCLFLSLSNQAHLSERWASTTSLWR